MLTLSVRVGIVVLAGVMMVIYSLKHAHGVRSVSFQHNGVSNEAVVCVCMCVVDGAALQFMLVLMFLCFLGFTAMCVVRSVSCAPLLLCGGQW